MLTAAVAISISATAQFQYLGYGAEDSRTLATQAPYVTDVAINGAWHPQIGREYHTLVWRKGQPVGLHGWNRPGPDAYGAHQDDYSLYYARVGNVVVSASPWVHVNDDSGLQRVERARQTWLREQGYTGGTRTFRNHRYTSHASMGSLENQGDWNKITIQLPKRPRFEVNAGEDAQPQQAPRVVVARADDARIVVRRETNETTAITRAD